MTRTLRRVGLLAALSVAIGIPVATSLVISAATSASGEDLGGFDAFSMAISILGIVAVTIGVMILWQRPRNVIGAMLVVGALLVMGTFLGWPTAAYRASIGGPHDPLGVLALLYSTNALLIGVFLLFPALGILFPDGRMPSRRWRLPFAGLVGAMALSAVIRTFAPWPPDAGMVNPFAIPGVPATVGSLSDGIAAAAVFVSAGLAVVAVVTRFRRASGVERAQLKWFLAALSVSAVLFPISFATDLGPADLIDVLSVAAACLVPVAVGIAILRYHLYDIDRLISRTIAYTIVTAILVVVFGGVILLFQALLSAYTQGQTIAVAASTLVAFALFQPVLKRVRRAVDRRFDRARYDADRTAVAFAERLRDQTDLGAVTTDLDRTSRTALGPRRVGIWIRGDER
jgi:hypothetical protein